MLSWARSPDAAMPIGIPKALALRDLANMHSCVYILQLDDNSYHIGSTSNLERRLLEHRRGAKAGTRFSKHPKILFRQNFKTYTQARNIEHKLKKLKNRKIIEKIISDGIIKI